MDDQVQPSKVYLNRDGFIDAVASHPKLVWNKKIPNTELQKFQECIEKKYNRQFGSYWEFHQWSVDNYVEFWEEIWIYFDIIASKPYEEVLVKTGEGILDNDWFTGATLNYAENLLRIRDDRIALICLDELGNEETVSFAEIFEQTKLYTAAFRKHGIIKGDRVGCYMSNRKEAVFVMLAATSIGAIWGGPLPFFGARAASSILGVIDPKIIIAVDHFQNDGVKYHPIDNLAEIVERIPNLEKVVIVHNKNEVLFQDISHIPKSISLEDFLKSGCTPEGEVPDLVFEQLSFNHPMVINFTSGTTGLPKATVHSTGAFIGILRDFRLHFNLKCDDVIYNNNPVGWSVWDYQIPTLALGIKQFLFAGCPCYHNKSVNFWNILSKYKVTYVYLPTSYLSFLEEENVAPDPDTTFDSLELFSIGASPVKPRNYEYVQRQVKKDLFIGSQYGATEIFGDITGFDLNSPCYMVECQLPNLGVDIHCLNTKGKSVVGQRGEMVLKTPYPGLPLYLWKDENNARMSEVYLSKFEGVWIQNDEIWINPKTRGIIVVGRSDDTINQNGERIGSSDIYFAIDKMEELKDYICVGQDKYNGDSRAVLFVSLKPGYTWTEELKEKIKQTVHDELSLDFVPEVILEVLDIPYNLTYKRMESVVRKIVATNQVPEVHNCKNPSCLQYFCNIPALLNYNKLSSD